MVPSTVKVGQRWLMESFYNRIEEITEVTSDFVRVRVVQCLSPSDSGLNQTYIEYNFYASVWTLLKGQDAPV